jgi:site-specific recombinase XerD
MALQLYRRHTRECSAKLPVGTRAYEADELRRKAKKCLCQIHASGTLRKFSRKCTNQITWEGAKEVAKEWEALGTWEKVNAGPAPEAPPAPEPAREPKKEFITVERAVKAFLVERCQAAAANTEKKYTLLMQSLKKYSDDKGYIGLDRWTVMDVREFRASWGVSPVTAAKNMSLIRGFFDFCVDNEWLEKSVAAKVKNPRNVKCDKRNEQKLPFSDEEVDLMYEVCERWGTHEIRCFPKKKDGKVVPTEIQYRDYRRKWTGQDLADFITLSVYTGLRISDVAMFHVSRMNDNGEIKIRAMKNGAWVCTWVPEWVQERIRTRSREIGPFIFGTHRTKDMNVITDVWRRKLKRIWDECGPWTDKPTPHRFRHSFACTLLQRPGVEVRDVAELLGDTEEMVRKHYSAWVPKRQERLTSVLKDAFREKPKRNVVNFPKRTGTRDSE